MAEESGSTNDLLLDLTSDLVAAYVSHNALSVTDLRKLIGEVHGALNSIVSPAPIEAPPPEPAVSVRKSITPDYLICLEDGQKLRSLKRHLRKLGMTPEEYREKWNLPADYPMVAPNFSAARAQIARAIGLGRKRTPESATVPVVVRKSRKVPAA
jgi:predicted transcriptional regulator